MSGDRRSSGLAPADDSIFSPDGQLGYLETDDYQAALDAMAVTDVNERWQAEMSEFFVADGLPTSHSNGFPRYFTWISRLTLPGRPGTEGSGLAPGWRGHRTQ